MRFSSKQMNWTECSNRGLRIRLKVLSRIVYPTNKYVYTRNYRFEVKEKGRGPFWFDKGRGPFDRGRGPLDGETDPQELRWIRPQLFKLVFKCVNMFIWNVYVRLCVSKTVITMSINLALRLWYTCVWILT